MGDKSKPKREAVINGSGIKLIKTNKTMRFDHAKDGSVEIGQGKILTNTIERKDCLEDSNNCLTLDGVFDT